MDTKEKLNTLKKMHRLAGEIIDADIDNKHDQKLYDAVSKALTQAEKDWNEIKSYRK